jgi:hypothetical protein
MFVFDARVSTRTRTVTDDLRGCTGRAAISPDPRYEVKELGEIDMVSMALATLDLVTHDAQPPRRTHECGADGHLADAFRELLG